MLLLNEEKREKHINEIISVDSEMFLTLVLYSIIFLEKKSDIKFIREIKQNNEYVFECIYKNNRSRIFNENNLRDIFLSTGVSLENNSEIFLKCISLVLENINVDNIHLINFNKKINLPKKLYKYVSNESKYIDVLFKGHISLTHKKHFDDIYDCPVETLCGLTGFADRLRILCLSNEKNIEAMWGCYANKFKGFCFTYSKVNIYKALIEKAKKNTFVFALHGDIEYKPNANKILNKKNNKNSLINIISEAIKSCFIKDKSWSFEKEHRIICFGEFNDNDFPLFNLKPSSYSFYSYLDNDVVDKNNKNTVSLFYK